MRHIQMKKPTYLILKQEKNKQCFTIYFIVLLIAGVFIRYFRQFFEFFGSNPSYHPSFSVNTRLYKPMCFKIAKEKLLYIPSQEIWKVLESAKPGCFSGVYGPRFINKARIIFLYIDSKNLYRWSLSQKIQNAD